MKLSHRLVGCALLACASVAQAAVIPVVNGSFEYAEDTWSALPASGNSSGGWVYTGVSGAYVVLDASAGHLGTFAEGHHALLSDNAFVNGPLSQVLSYTVNSGDVLTLDFYVARGTSVYSGPGALEATIKVGGNVLVTGNNFATTSEANIWEKKTLTGTATTGGSLEIIFNDASGALAAPFLDNVTMSVAPVPEPASLGLLSLAGLALMRRRK